MSGRILIVDDEEDTIALIRHHLVAADFEVLHALDGVRALDIAVRVAPDLIVSDVCMPGFDGFGLLAALRANEETRGVPFLFLTVRDDHASIERATRLGADGYLPKPVQRAALLEAVAVRLALSRHRRAAAQEEGALQRAAADRLLAVDTHLCRAEDIAKNVLHFARRLPLA